MFRVHNEFTTVLPLRTYTVLRTNVRLVVPNLLLEVSNFSLSRLSCEKNFFALSRRMCITVPYVPYRYVPVESLLTAATKESLGGMYFLSPFFNNFVIQGSDEKWGFKGETTNPVAQTVTGTIFTNTTREK